MNNRADDSRRTCVPASRSDIMALSGPSRGQILPIARALFIPNNRQHRGAQGKPSRSQILRLRGCRYSAREGMLTLPRELGLRGVCDA